MPESGEEVKDTEEGSPPAEARPVRLRRFWRSRPASERTPKPVDLVEHHERQRAFREKLMANAPAIVSASVFAFVVMKVVIVSDTNVSTALAVVSRAGPLQVIAGVLVIGLPFIGTGLTNAAGIVARTNLLNKYERRRLWFYYFVGGFILSFVLPWLVTLFIIAFALFSLLLWRKERNAPAAPAPVAVEQLLQTKPEDTVLRHLHEQMRVVDSNLKEERAKESPDNDRVRQLQAQISQLGTQYNERIDKIREVGGLRLDALAITLILTTLAPMAQLTLNDTPWLPAEVLESRDGSSFAGYVLAADDKWVTVLQDEPRLVTSFPTRDVRDRRICAVSGATNSRTTLWDFWDRDPSEYPACESMQDGGDEGSGSR